jgi:hypothetical protein
MPLVRFEPAIWVLERAKTFRALDRAATAIGADRNAQSLVKQNAEFNFSLGTLKLYYSRDGEGKIELICTNFVRKEGNMKFSEFAFCLHTGIWNLITA